MREEDQMLTSVADAPRTAMQDSTPSQGRGEVWEPCPFDVRLARTPYLVLPKLALQAMPMDWRKRLEALLAEADDTGMETPAYQVFRDDPAYNIFRPEDPKDQYSGTSRVVVLRSDPWANYRHGKIKDLCPGFTPPVAETPHSNTAKRSEATDVTPNPNPLTP